VRQRPLTRYSHGSSTKGTKVHVGKAGFPTPREASYSAPASKDKSSGTQGSGFPTPLRSYVGQAGFGTRDSEAEEATASLERRRGLISTDGHPTPSVG
jgi:hypothetical protein